MGLNQEVRKLGALGFSVPQTADGYIEAVPLFGCHAEPECQELSKQCVEVISLVGHPSADSSGLYKAFEIKALSQKWDLLIVAEKVEKIFEYKVFWIRRVKRFAWGFLFLCVGFVLACGCCVYFYKQNINLEYSLKKHKDKIEQNEKDLNNNNNSENNKLKKENANAFELLTKLKELDSPIQELNNKIKQLILDIDKIKN